MAPKGGNAKKESGRAKKADNEAKKSAATAAKKETEEDTKWSQGAKSTQKDDEKKAKREAELRRKADIAQQLAEEEASAPSKPKPAPKAAAKKATPQKKDVKPAGPGAIAAGGGLGAVDAQRDDGEPERVESYAATGIDNALDLLEVVNAKTDKASVGSKAADIERHPERRFKAAFEAYKEKELPNIKEERPGMRLHQYHDLLYKQFQKAPENPFNQATVAFDASKDERVAVLEEERAKVTARLRED